MKKTEKVFLETERFETGLFVWYSNPEWAVKAGEPAKGRFFINDEDSRQFLKADLDSWHYFQNKLTESMKEYQVILLGLVDILKEEYIDGGWDEEATGVARDYCWDMEGQWHNIECYQMILEELKKKL